MGCSVSRQIQAVEEVAQEVHNLTLEQSQNHATARNESNESHDSSLIVSRKPSQQEELNQLLKQQAEWDVGQTQQEESSQVPTTWTKTACCGRQCQIASSRVCCEHDFTRPLGHYCAPCREKYIDWHEANQVFEGMIQELEQSNQNVCHLSQHSRESQQSAQPSMVYVPLEEDKALPLDKCTAPQDKCAVCLDPFSSTSGLLCILPCGHSVCHSHMDKADRCPLCRTSMDGSNGSNTGSGVQFDYSSDRSVASAPQPDPETQTGRYEVMHSPSPKKRHAVVSVALTAEERRYLYLSGQEQVVSSLSLGGESETCTMDSSSG